MYDDRTAGMGEGEIKNAVEDAVEQHESQRAHDLKQQGEQRTKLK